MAFFNESTSVIPTIISAFCTKTCSEHLTIIICNCSPKSHNPQSRITWNKNRQPKVIRKRKREKQSKRNLINYFIYSTMQTVHCTSLIPFVPRKRFIHNMCHFRRNNFPLHGHTWKPCIIPFKIRHFKSYFKSSCCVKHVVYMKFSFFFSIVLWKM